MTIARQRSMILDDELPAEFGEVRNPLSRDRNDIPVYCSQIPEVDEVSGFMCVQHKESGVSMIMVGNLDLRMPYTQG
jgi:hypothetical protein